MRISDWSSDVCSSDLDSAILFRSPTERPQGWFGVVHADPQVPALPELIEDFSEASGAYLVGGLIAGRGARPQWAGKAAEGSMSGVVFSEAQPEIGRASCRERVCQYV